MQDIPYAIQITNVYKQYRLGQIGGGTLRGDLSSWWAKVRGQEDPNTKIGSDQRIQGGTFMALNGIDLTIKPGEAVGIIGCNGAGKSTLLKLLSRVTAPTEGEIDIYGRVSSMLEVGTGFNREMTGRENIYMNGAILGMTKAEIDAKMEQIIDFSEVREFIDTPVKRYSSGMYVKLAFSVAAHLDSEIMIMDEVLAVGDMVFQKKCLDKMKEAANGEGRTVLYVSHNMATIRALCDRCIVLDGGRIIYDGDVEEAIELYMKSSQTLDAHREYHMADYADKSRSGFQILSSDIEKASCQFMPGEPVAVRLNCKSIDPLHDVFFRFQLVAEDGSRVGSMFTDRGISLSGGKTIAARFHLSTGELAPGKYLAEVAVYTGDLFGNQAYINTLKNSFWFEIIPSVENQYTLRWHRNWGHTHLADVQVEVLDRE